MCRVGDQREKEGNRREEKKRANTLYHSNHFLSSLRNTLNYLFPHLYQNFLLYSAHHSVKLMVASSTIAYYYIPSLYLTLGRTKHEL